MDKKYQLNSIENIEFQKSLREELGQMKNLLLVDPVKMVSMTILRNVNLKKYLGAT